MCIYSLCKCIQYYKYFTLIKGHISIYTGNTISHILSDYQLH